MSVPKVSIITICFNNVKGLQKTITSVKNQTYADFEYIIVDGGSTDGSSEILAAETNAIDAFISEPDTGIYNAMNKGISIAKGVFLQFLNAGDVYTSTTALYDFVNHSLFFGDIIYGDYQFETRGKMYPDELTPQFFMRSSLPHQSTLISKKVFDIIGLYDESYKIIGDRAHFVKAFLSNQFQFQRVPIALTVFDLTGISNAPEYRALKIDEDTKMFKEYFGIYYQDYVELLAIKQQLKVLKRQTLGGILKRIHYKIKSIWSRH